MTDARQRLGKTGEDLAVRELVSRGYAILARRYRSRHGEIDIVCNDRGTIVFVEVRARSTHECGLASESITRQKMRRITACAVDYLSRHHLSNRPCRFDVVAIENAFGPNSLVTVYANAFDRVG
ncbi:MAG TPA: YraN family protein [Vicinamibacterales bacterium]|nr:YraN family protein [Vicinamibacterales bacterium]